MHEQLDAVMRSRAQVQAAWRPVDQELWLALQLADLRALVLRPLSCIEVEAWPGSWQHAEPWKASAKGRRVRSKMGISRCNEYIVVVATFGLVVVHPGRMRSIG